MRISSLPWCRPGMVRWSPPRGAIASNQYALLSPATARPRAATSPAPPRRATCWPPRRTARRSGDRSRRSSSTAPRPTLPAPGTSRQPIGPEHQRLPPGSHTPSAAAGAHAVVHAHHRRRDEVPCAGQEAAVLGLERDPLDAQRIAEPRVGRPERQPLDLGDQRLEVLERGQPRATRKKMRASQAGACSRFSPRFQQRGQRLGAARRRQPRDQRRASARKAGRRSCRAPRPREQVAEPDPLAREAQVALDQRRRRAPAPAASSPRASSLAGPSTTSRQSARVPAHEAAARRASSRSTAPSRLSLAVVLEPCG